MKIKKSDINILNPEFIMRMVVDSENLKSERRKFLNNIRLSDSEIKRVLNTKPFHHDINWGVDRISMVPWTGLLQLHACIVDTVLRKVEGDFVETGAWRGGSCIIAKATYNYLDSSKKVFVVDSFEGLPKPDPHKYPDDKNDNHYMDENMKASLVEVKNNFKKFGCLDDKVVFIKGWFKDTLPNCKINKISVLRLDGDMYESTVDVLKNLYHKLSIGGYCIIDDYQHPACREAVYDFRKFHGITEKIVKVDKDPLNEVHYWIKLKKTKFVDVDYSKKGFYRFIYRLVQRFLNIFGRYF